jgi:hypothetical protein
MEKENSSSKLLLWKNRSLECGQRCEAKEREKEEHKKWTGVR